jgi:hypothetical protein
MKKLKTSETVPINPACDHKFFVSSKRIGNTLHALCQGCGAVELELTEAGKRVDRADDFTYGLDGVSC